jgi:hypothetical protein
MFVELGERGGQANQAVFDGIFLRWRFVLCSKCELLVWIGAA